MNSKTLDFVYVALLIALAAFIYYSTSLDYMVDGRPLYPESTQDKTAVYVRFLAGALGFLSILLLIKAIISHVPKSLDFVKRPRAFFSLVVALIIYVLIMLKAGFFISSALFLPVTMWLMGHRNFLTIGVSTVGLLGFIYLLFVQLFGVPLPEINF